MILNAPDPKLTPFETLPSGGYTAITKSAGRDILEMYFHGVSMEGLCAYISVGSRFPPVHDATGLAGRYDFALRSADSSQRGVTPWELEPLGLELKPGKSHGFSLVIDHVEKPSAN
jgi:uncharacterized protein (TIGR03435 family)